MSLVRKLIDCSSNILGKAKRHQRVKTSEDMELIRLNLGCGLAVIPNWINIDGSLNALLANMPSFFHRVIYRITGANRYYSKDEYCRLLGNHVFVHHDLSRSIPFNDGTVDCIYSAHFLEQLYRVDAQRILDESYRVLKPGGTTRIPDLEYAFKLYKSGQRHEMLADYFFVEDDGSYYARHKYMYGFTLLSEALFRAGFHNIRRCEYQQGVVPDVAMLDNRPDESLFVEATC